MTSLCGDSPWVPEEACSCPEIVDSSALNRQPIDNMWMLMHAVTILGMQVGFALLEGGYTRKMHMANIMMKNLADLVLSGVGFFLVGYRIAYYGVNDDNENTSTFSDFMGTPRHPFQGVAGSAIDPVFFFFQWSFAATASTIDSGGLAERVNFFAYLILSTWVSTIVYPVVAHWAWGGGWLQQMGFVDFAGGACVHGLGGVSAIASVAFVGPRIGRYPEYVDWKSKVMRKCLRRKVNSAYFRVPEASHERAFWVDLNPPGAASNPVQLLFGTLMLWVGWYGFNPASTFAVTNNQDSRAGMVALTTTLGACCGGVTGLCYSIVKLRKLQCEVGDLCNGCIAGLVSITAGCRFVTPIGACVIGILVPLAMFPFSKFVEKMGLDDVVAAISVHGFCGMLGTVAIGLLSHPDCIVPGEDVPLGLFYGGSGKTLGVQIAGVLAISAWTFTTTLGALHLIDMVLHMRVHRFEELVGLDYCEHNFCEDPGQRHRLQKQLEALRQKIEDDSDSFTKEDGAPDDDMNNRISQRDEDGPARIRNSMDLATQQLSKKKNSGHQNGEVHEPDKEEAKRLIVCEADGTHAKANHFGRCLSGALAPAADETPAHSEAVGEEVHDDESRTLKSFLKQRQSSFSEGYLTTRVHTSHTGTGLLTVHERSEAAAPQQDPGPHSEVHGRPRIPPQSERRD